MKQCSKCKKVLDRSCFYKHRTKDGLSPHCKKCHAIYKQAVYRRHKENGLFDEINRRRREAYAKNNERINARMKEWRSNNKDKMKASDRKSKLKSIASVYARNKARLSAQKQATPVWADIGMIAAVYLAARKISSHDGGKWHVDHIVPLNGKNVCGLHVEYNLQIMPDYQNTAKGNRIKENDCGRQIL